MKIDDCMMKIDDDVYDVLPILQYNDVRNDDDAYDNV